MNPDNVYVYDGEHGVTFIKGSVTKHTWHDWGLIPSSRFTTPADPIWSQKVTISGINGQEDLIRMYPYMSVNDDITLSGEIQNDHRNYILSDSDHGYDIFQPKAGSLSFTIADQSVSFFAKQQEIMNFLHNQNVRMAFSDNSSVLYNVRTTIEAFSSGQKFSSVTIGYSMLGES